MPLDWTQVIDEARLKTDDGGGYKAKWRSVLKTAGGKHSSYEQRAEFARLLVDNDLAIAPHIDGASRKKDDYVTIIDASHLPPREQLHFETECPLEDLIEAVMPNFPGLKASSSWDYRRTSAARRSGRAARAGTYQQCSRSGLAS